MQWKIFKKINRIELIKFLIWSVLILLIPIIAYPFKLDVANIWWTTFVFQFGIGALWWIVKVGLFGETHGFRNYFQNLSKISNRNQKQSLKKTSLNDKTVAAEKSTSKQGCYLMMLSSLIYLVIALVVSYA